MLSETKEMAEPKPKQSLNLETFQLVNGKLVYNCVQCNLNFSQNSQFYRHLSEKHAKLNKDTAKYVCNDCNQLFTKKYMLDIHYQTRHLSKASSKCETCFVTFKSKLCLRSHIKSKQCKQDNKCLKCQKSYLNADKLASHVANNHSFKKVGYSCYDCHKSFKNMDSLVSHKRRLHLLT